jgi:hypothetical protein
MVPPEVEQGVVVGWGFKVRAIAGCVYWVVDMDVTT